MNLVDAGGGSLATAAGARSLRSFFLRWYGEGAVAEVTAALFFVAFAVTFS